MSSHAVWGTWLGRIPRGALLGPPRVGMVSDHSGPKAHRRARTCRPRVHRPRGGFIYRLLPRVVALMPCHRQRARSGRDCGDKKPDRLPRDSARAPIDVLRLSRNVVPGLWCEDARRGALEPHRDTRRRPNVDGSRVEGRRAPTQIEVEGVCRPF
jgi:hypothetical protein